MPIFLLMNLNGEEQTRVEALFYAHEPGLHRFAYAFLRNHVLAEDVVQDAFFSLIRDAERLKGRSERELRNYLFRKAKYLIRDVLKSRQDEFPAESEWIQRLMDETAAERSAIDALSDATFGERLDEAIDGLSESAQEIIYLKYFEMLTNGEIAERFGLSYGAVSTRLSRAYGELRNALEAVK